MKTPDHYCYKALLWLVLLIATGCNTEPRYWANKEIPADVHDELQSLHGNVLKYMQQGNSNELEKFLSEGLVLNKFSRIEGVSMGKVLSSNNYELMDEYYAINKYRDIDTIKVPAGINTHELRYMYPECETYIVMMLEKNGVNRQLMTFIYSKFSYGWKLSAFNSGLYTVNGMTAPQHITAAEEAYAAGDYFDAFNSAKLATSCIHPANIWQYDKAASAVKLFTQITNVTSKLEMPFVFTQVASKPVIFGLYNQTNNEGTYPQICYVSGISLSDTIALKKENEIIRANINTVFPGIEKLKKYVYYSVYKKLPSRDEIVPHFDIQKKLH